MPSFSRISVALSIAAVALLAGPLSREAAAQERPRPAVEIAAGSVGFADDGIVYETLVGGAARLYLSPRVSVGPEFAHIGSDRHSHLMLTGNVTFDLLRPSNRQPRRVTPYVVVGGGLYQTREQFPGRGTYTSGEGTFTAGGGLRLLAGPRVTIGADARIGWEPHVRLSGTIGVLLGR